MERVITFTSFTQGINPMRQPHPQDTDSVLQPAGFHVDILSPLSLSPSVFLFFDGLDEFSDGILLRMEEMGPV